MKLSTCVHTCVIFVFNKTIIFQGVFSPIYCDYCEADLSFRDQQGFAFLVLPTSLQRYEIH